MAEIPRKPNIPEPIIAKFIQRVQGDVDDNVIPVSTGIYTEEGLIQKLKDTTKPFVQHYDDPVFFELGKLSNASTDTCCKGCKKQYGLHKDKPTQCRFCAQFYCPECISYRKRLHPLDKNPNGQRYTICSGCDLRYLNLQMSHGYVQTKTLMQNSIMKVSDELQELEMKVEAMQAVRKKRIMNQVASNHKIKISAIQKQVIDNKKVNSKLAAALAAQHQRNAQLLSRMQQISRRYNSWSNKQQTMKTGSHGDQQAKDEPMQAVEHETQEQEQPEQQNYAPEQSQQANHIQEQQSKGSHASEQPQKGNYAPGNYIQVTVQQTSPITLQSLAELDNAMSPDEAYDFPQKSAYMPKQDAAMADSQPQQSERRQSDNLNNNYPNQSQTITDDFNSVMYAQYFNDTLGDSLSCNQIKQGLYNHETGEQSEVDFKKARQDLLKEVIKRQQEIVDQEYQPVIIEPSKKCSCQLF